MLLLNVDHEVKKLYSVRDLKNVKFLIDLFSIKYDLLGLLK